MKAPQPLNNKYFRSMNQRPGKENPIPTKTDPEPEQPSTQPGRSIKRKKESIYEITC